MIETLAGFIVSADTALFRFLNGKATCAFLDALMPFVTNTKNFYPVFILLFAGLLIFGKYRQRLAALTIVLGAVLADIISSKILKEIFARPRPFETLENVRQLVGAAGYSMPSSHAVNSFCVATMFTLFFNKKNPAFNGPPALKILKRHWVALVSYFIAFMSAYSRVYVGVHYPSDALSGAMIGIVVGWMIYKITTLILRREELTR